MTGLPPALFLDSKESISFVLFHFSSFFDVNLVNFEQ